MDRGAWIAIIAFAVMLMASWDDIRHGRLPDPWAETGRAGMSVE